MLLDGRYELGDALGQGGFGTVYRARDMRLRRTVAVKALEVDSGLRAHERQVITERFEREAQSLATLTHPNVVVAHDFGVDGPAAYIVMEFVAGRSLAQELHERAERHAGPLDLAAAIRIAEQICAGLDAAHRALLVHRDLKPGNIMLTEDGNVKIVDFGIARMGTRTPLTRTGFYVGTWAYSAPEQALARGVDGRADLYSLGVMIHEMLSGRYPFDAETDLQWMHAHQTTAPAPLRAHAPSAPAEMESLVLALLAKDPAARLATATEVRNRLSAIAAASAQTQARHTPR